MKITKLEIADAYLIEREAITDDRGYFARMFCVNEFLTEKINVVIKQINMCENKKKGTIRGMHYQQSPYEEEKIVACSRGAVYDVFVDLRKKSKTYKKYLAYELSERNGRMLYIPKGCAHGYMTLEEDTQLIYFMTEFYHPESACGIRYDDPAVGIKWPDIGNIVISEKDKKLQYII